MSLLSTVLRGSETKTVDVTNLTWQAMLGGPLVKSGVRVSIDTALRNSTVLACCRVLSEALAQLPLKVMIERKSGRKEVAYDHPLHQVLYRKPNAWQTPFEWIESSMYHSVLGRGSFSIINRVGGKVDELIPLSPNNVTTTYARGDLLIEVSDPIRGFSGTYPREALFRVRGPSWNSVQALEMVRQAAESVGLSQAIEESQARLQANGARPSGVLSQPGPLSKEARERLEGMFKDGFQGVMNAGKVPILDGGLKFEAATMTGVDAQTLESRKFQVVEIARMFRVHPQMLFESDKTSTYASAAQFAEDFVKWGLMPWVVRWEQAITRDLLSAEDIRAGYFAHFVLEGLLRGAQEARAAYFKSALGTSSSPGWASPNEVRRIEDMDPHPDPAADRIITAEDLAGKLAKAPGEPGGDPGATPAAVPGDGAAAVADTALNGAQVASLLAIVQAVADGTLPPATARAMILASFPGVPTGIVDEMLKGLEGWEPEEPEPPADPPADPPDPADDPTKDAGVKALGASLERGMASLAAGLVAKSGRQPTVELVRDASGQVTSMKLKE